MRTTCIILLFLLSFAASKAQVRTITGKVTDERQNPIEGASIQVKHAPLACLSGADGNFSLQLPVDKDTVLVSYVGYFTKELRVSSPLNIILQLKEGSLSEVQIIGYGSLTKVDVTGSATTVKADQLED